MLQFILTHFWTLLVIIGTMFTKKYRWIGISYCLIAIGFQGNVPWLINWIFAVVVIYIGYSSE